MERTKSHQILKRLIPPLAIWAISRVLETENVQGALREVDSRAYVRKRDAMRSITRAGRNAASNPAWLAAGAAAIAVGISLMAKAARGK
jgi:hypothetical protein